MEQLHDTVDKLATDADHLSLILDVDEIDPERAELALSVAKRVRRESTLVVRLLAAIRDQLQPKEGTSS